MNLRQLLLAAGLGLLGLSLMAGYNTIGNRTGFLISGLCILAWLSCWWSVRRVSSSDFLSGLPSVCLFVSVGLAASGLVLGAPVFLMIGAVSLSLAVWDLLTLDVALSGHFLGEQSQRYEARHLRSLGLALGSGILLCHVARLTSFHVPFAVLLLLVAAVVLTLDRIWTVTKSRGPE